VVLGRRVRADDVTVKRFHPPAGPLHGPPDRPDPVLAVRVLQDAVHVDDAPRAERRERVGQEVHRGMGEVQEDPVQGRGLSQDDAGVPLAHLDAVRTVGRGVAPQQVHRDRVGVRRDDPRGCASLRDEDGIGAHPRERIGHGLPGAHLVRDAESLASETGAEVGPGHVHVVPQPEFRADGRRAVFSGDDFEVPDAELPSDSVVLGDNAQRVAPCQDGPADLPAMGDERLRNLEHRDVADHVEGGGELRAEVRGHADDVLVAPDGAEGLLELPLLDGPSQVDPLARREEEAAALLRHLEVLLERCALLELAPDLLALLARDDDAPGAHGSGHGRGG